MLRNRCTTGLAALGLLVALAANAGAQTTAFTYQGKLAQDGAPANGNYDMVFAAYTAASGGTLMGSTTVASVPVSGGLFTTQVDLGVQRYGTLDLWLQVQVRPTGTATYTTLTPRQRVTGAPYSVQTRGLHVDSASRVGIGTTSPLQQLAVVDTDALPMRIQRVNSSATASAAALELLGDVSGTPEPGLGASLDWRLRASTRGVLLAGQVDVFWENPVTGSSATAMRFRTYGDGNIRERMRIRSNGDIGIGTVGPAARLHVLATSGDVLNLNDRLTVAAANGQTTITGTVNSGGLLQAVQGTTGDTPAVYAEANQVVNYGIAVAGYSAWRGIMGVGTRDGAGTRTGVYGNVVAAATTNYGVYGTASGGTTNWAGYFAGNANVAGTLSKGAGAFRIDHPLDPENKFLYHSFVESPDMLNLYNGNVVTDERGYAKVEMPEWFEALNQEFRYQLTVIDENDSDEFVLAKVVRPIEGNRFTIRTSAPFVQVSWQVTGIRHDPYAVAHRIPIEEYKPLEHRGKYVHPDVYTRDATAGIDWEDSQIAR